MKIDYIAQLQGFVPHQWSLLESPKVPSSKFLPSVLYQELGEVGSLPRTWEIGLGNKRQIGKHTRLPSVEGKELDGSVRH